MRARWLVLAGLAVALPACEAKPRGESKPPPCIQGDPPHCEGPECEIPVPGK